MQSSLNEGHTLDTIMKAITDTATERNNNRKNDKFYLGGSISRYAQRLMMSFPVLCDNTLSVQTMQLISKANEKNIVSLLRIMFSDKCLEGSSGAEIISKIHKNLGSMDIDQVISALDQIVGENADPAYERQLNAECRDALREMMIELKTPQKSFPVESLNEKSLNGYMVKNDMYGNMHVIAVKEAQKDDEEEKKNPYEKAMDATDDNYKGQGPGTNSEGNKTENPDYMTPSDYEDLQRKRREEERKEEKHRRDMVSGSARDRDMANQAMTRQILDSDFKKANELQPTEMVVNFNYIKGETVIERRSFVCGIKCRLIGVDGMDIAERIGSKNKDRLSFKNFIKATTGETSLLKDFLAATKTQKLHAKKAAKNGISAQLWNVLEKRSSKNARNKFRATGNDATAITTLIVNAETAAYITSAYKFDINVEKNAKFIMDSYNLLGLFIADEANEVVKVMYDGNNQFEMISYQALAKEYNDASSYKKTVNLINQMGR